MGPHYNRINFSIKTALPSSCSVRHFIPQNRFEKGNAIFINFCYEDVTL